MTVELQHRRPARSLATIAARLEALRIRRPRLIEAALMTAVLLLAAALRLWRLGQPGTLMFDETYYVKDAWTLLHLGYEGSWPEGADAAFNAGDVDSYSADASYVAHPPLGKWLIALGMAATGGADPVGWRLSAAVAGVLAVLLVMLIAKGLFHSLPLALIAGGLMAIDGHAITMSRVSLLDGFLTLLTLAAFGAVLLDRRSTARRIRRRLVRAGLEIPPRRRRKEDAKRHRALLGLILLLRPWLLTASLLLGLATAVKWSGLYFLAVLLVAAVVSDALLRRRLGVRLWWAGGLLQGATAAVTTLPLALGAYLASWTGWFATTGGYDRDHLAAQPEDRFAGALAWIPDALQNLWAWHASIYTFHTGLDAEHNYRSPAWQWPLLLRPTAVYYEGTAAGQGGCTADACSTAVTVLGNPLIWWAAVVAVVWAVVMVVRRRDAALALLLTGVLAGYGPWLLYPERTTFHFYAIAFLPYLVLLLTAGIGAYLRSTASDPRSRRIGRAVVAAFLVLAALLSAFFWPIWTGVQIPTWYWRLHMWLPGWV